jgi:hypothetical protein
MMTGNFSAMSRPLNLQLLLALTESYPLHRPEQVHSESQAVQIRADIPTPGLNRFSIAASGRDIWGQHTQFGTEITIVDSFDADLVDRWIKVVLSSDKDIVFHTRANVGSNEHAATEGRQEAGS